MSGCRLVGRQLSLILRKESSFAERDKTRTWVTEECDKAEVVVGCQLSSLES